MPPLTDEQAKQAYDATLQPEEEQRKYWDVHTTITLEYVIPRFGTRAEVEELDKQKSLEFAQHLDADTFHVEITNIIEQEGE